MFKLSIDSNLYLQILDKRHAGRLFTLVDANRAYLREWLPWLDLTKEKKDTHDFIVKNLNCLIESGTFVAGIWFDSKLSGLISYNEINWTHGTAVIGYWLAENCQGHGIMTKACKAMIDHAFLEYKLNEIIIYCDPNNYKSRAIPTRLGFTEGELTKNAAWHYDHYKDHIAYHLKNTNPSAPD